MKLIKLPREITTHQTNEANRKLRVTADARNAAFGNASHYYMIDIPEAPTASLSFQQGPIQEAGVNGVTNEVLLAIVKDRLEGFQESEFACPENAQALAAVEQALAALESRTRAREARGVEGTNQV